MSSGLDGPLVSVIVPMLNETGYISDCLQGFEAQTWPIEQLEVLVVDGQSDDGSREFVTDYAMRHPWVRLVDNPSRRTPVAFNLGVDAARGDFVCFFSAHGVPSPTYVAATVEVLQSTGATGVGGQYIHEGLDPASMAIGLTMASPFGMASPHRFANEQVEVDTISHPGYRIGSVREVGGFDESMHRNQDYELNWRLRQRGGRLIFDPTIASTYRPRGSLKALLRQFWSYGRFKARMVSHHPRSLKPRHLAPPAVAVFGAATPLLATSGGGRRLVGIAVAGYLALLLLAIGRERPRRAGASLVTFVASFPVMHGAWGAGFVVGAIKDRGR